MVQAESESRKFCRDEEQAELGEGSKAKSSQRIWVMPRLQKGVNIGAGTIT